MAERVTGGWKARSEAQERELREASMLLLDFAHYVDDSRLVLNHEDVAAAIRLVVAQVAPDATVRNPSLDGAV